jgi:hypothetical protein
MPRGGINLKSLALREIKKRLAFDVVNIHGAKVLAPGHNWDDLYAAFNQLLSIRLLSITNIRMCKKKIEIARTLWPKKQTELNVVADLCNQKELECLERAAKRAEKRLIRDVVDPAPDGKRGPGRPRKILEPSPVPAAVASEVLPASPVELWKAMLAKQQQQEKRT